jgi:hypothetical protein
MTRDWGTDGKQQKGKVPQNTPNYGKMRISCQEIRIAVLAIQLFEKSVNSPKEKATRQQGGLFVRENSSNGGKAIRTFLAQYYG